MIVMAVKYYVKPGMGDQVAAGLHKMAPLVKEQEPGCMLYQASRSQENPDLFLLYECYTDEAALLAHRETPYFKEIIEATIMPMLEKRERELYTSVVT